MSGGKAFWSTRSNRGFWVGSLRNRKQVIDEQGNYKIANPQFQGKGTFTGGIESTTGKFTVGIETATGLFTNGISVGDDIDVIDAEGKWLGAVKFPFIFIESADAPKNAKAAEAVLTFEDSVSDGETVTIGNTVYEFDTDEDTEEGTIVVDVSGGATAADATAALLAALADNDDVDAAQVDSDNKIKVTAKVKGAAGNEIEVDTTCNDAAWGVEGDTLDGGEDGTEADKGTVLCDGVNVYVAIADNGVSDTNWRKISLGSAY